MQGSWENGRKKILLTYEQNQGYLLPFHAFIEDKKGEENKKTRMWQTKFPAANHSQALLLLLGGSEKKKRKVERRANLEKV